MILSCIIVACTTFLSEKTAATISGILVTPHLTLSSWNKLVSYKLLVIVYLPKFVSNLSVEYWWLFAKLYKCLSTFGRIKQLVSCAEWFWSQICNLHNARKSAAYCVGSESTPRPDCSLSQMLHRSRNFWVYSEFFVSIGSFFSRVLLRVLIDSWVKIGRVEPACPFSIYILNNPRFGKLSYKKR